MGRDINKMDERLKLLYFQLDNILKFKNISYMITCVERTVIEHLVLYVQGRLKTKEVNSFREYINLYPLTDDQNKIVTWTLFSKHIINPEKNINYSRAFDIAILKDRKPVWDIKIDVNKNDIPDYEEVGIIAEKLQITYTDGKKYGLKWGGRFKNPDYPHFELCEL
ncbi:MAG: M15 family metallopeptidase [Thermoplasmata archaeon]